MIPQFTWGFIYLLKQVLFHAHLDTFVFGSACKRECVIFSRDKFDRCPMPLATLERRLCWRFSIFIYCLFYSSSDTSLWKYWTFFHVEQIKAYPKTTAVLVRNHGIYVWGDSWISAKTQVCVMNYISPLLIVFTNYYFLFLPYFSF